MFDMIVVLDAPSELRCSEGHALCSFHTKDLPEPSMSTYLMQGGRLYLAAGNDDTSMEDALAWRIEGTEAIHARSYQLCEVQLPTRLRVYGSCDACEPVLVRTEASRGWSDLVVEHALFQDFQLTFRAGEPVQIERLCGTREELEREMRSRGLFVLAAGDALAVAHRELRRARERQLARAKHAPWPT
jgi:hypothetical protein